MVGRNLGVSPVPRVEVRQCLFNRGQHRYGKHEDGIRRLVVGTDTQGELTLGGAPPHRRPIRRAKSKRPALVPVSGANVGQAGPFRRARVDVQQPRRTSQRHHDVVVIKLRIRVDLDGVHAATLVTARPLIGTTALIAAFRAFWTASITRRHTDGASGCSVRMTSRVCPDLGRRVRRVPSWRGRNGTHPATPAVGGRVGRGIGRCGRWGW